ncbi:MAG: division/cell wall cluster transcriptional repressor MraZ [Halioglobus sp.]
MFHGVHNINMDAKGRMAMPTRLREPLQALCEGRIVVTIDTQTNCLVIYPYPEWEIIAAKIEALPDMQPITRRFKRLKLGYASELELDGNGRVLLPPPLREYAKLEKKLMLAGIGNKLELWSEDLWQGECEQALQDSLAGEELPDELRTLTL